MGAVPSRCRAGDRGKVGRGRRSRRGWEGWEGLGGGVRRGKQEAWALKPGQGSGPGNGLLQCTSRCLGSKALSTEVPRGRAVTPWD